MGKEEEVNRITNEVRKLDPDHIFVKDRGFPPGDPRRCRANLGGARPGFHGIEYEMTILPYISHALETLSTRDAMTVPAPATARERPKLDIYTLKKMIDAQEP
jgi:putative methanogenesis marker protein 6